MSYTNEKLTVAKDFAVVMGPDVTTAGTIQDLANDGFSFVRLTLGTTLESVVAYNTGKDLTIVNANSVSLLVKNETGGTAANRIITGTGSDYSMPAGSQILMKYDVTAARWRITGSPAAVPDASASVSGVVNTTTQQFAGFKTFTSGMTQAGDTDTTTTGTVTLLATSKRQRTFNTILTGDITLELPTGATVLKGDCFRIDLTYANAASGFVIIVQADDNTDIDGDNARIASGYLVLRAKQDNPTTGSHWEVSDVYEVRKSTASWTYNDGTTTPASSNIKLSRYNKTVTFYTGPALGTPSATTALLTTGVILPVRFRPLSTDVRVHGVTRINSVNTNFIGVLNVQTNGVVEFANTAPALQSPGVGANKEMTATANTGLGSSAAVTYILTVD